jgi:hypothetical protein
VIRLWIIEIHGALHEPKPEHTAVEVEIPLRVAGDGRDVMDSENLGHVICSTFA